MLNSFDLSRIKMLILSRWGLLLGAVSIYAAIFLAGQAGVCLTPPQRLQKEDYQFLALKRASFPGTRIGDTKIEKYINTKDDAIAFVASNSRCCDVIHGASDVNRLISSDGLNLAGAIFGIKYTTVVLRGIYINRTANVVFNQCGHHVGSE